MAYVDKCSNFVKTLDLIAWEHAISKEHYDKVLAKNAEKKQDLVELDNWMLNTLPKIVKDRDEPHLTQPELSKLMKWKITKGTWRPRLQKYIDDLDANVVVETTKEGFKAAESGEIERALKVLGKLKGVGPATASAILSVYEASVPPMGDEVLEVLVKSRNYKLPEGLKLREKCMEIANELNKKCDEATQEEGKMGRKSDTAVEWNANLVQLAIWAVAHSDDFDAQGALTRLPSPEEKAKGPVKHEDVKQEAVKHEDVKHEELAEAGEEEEGIEEDIEEQAEVGEEFGEEEEEEEEEEAFEEESEEEEESEFAEEEESEFAEEEESEEEDIREDVAPEVAKGKHARQEDVEQSAGENVEEGTAFAAKKLRTE